MLNVYTQALDEQKKLAAEPWTLSCGPKTKRKTQRILNLGCQLGCQTAELRPNSTPVARTTMAFCSHNQVPPVGLEPTHEV